MSHADGPSIAETHNPHLSLRSVGVAGLRFESYTPFPQFCAQFKGIPNRPEDLLAYLYRDEVLFSVHRGE